MRAKIHANFSTDSSPSPAANKTTSHPKAYPPQSKAANRQLYDAAAKQVFVEHQVTKKRKKIYLRKDDQVRYPFKEMKYGQ